MQLPKASQLIWRAEPQLSPWLLHTSKLTVSSGWKPVTVTDACQVWAPPPIVRQAEGLTNACGTQVAVGVAVYVRVDVLVRVLVGVLVMVGVRVMV